MKAALNMGKLACHCVPLNTLLTFMYEPVHLFIACLYAQLLLPLWFMVCPSVSGTCCYS